MSNNIASTPEKSRGRLHKESGSSFRSPYQRDRDRIIHSNAFRRLEYKTQVFVNHEGDHYRTRLTHSIEVSQIARTLATLLGLDVHLAEAIALAHDLGHTPFGHAGEDALKSVYPDFDHNGQTIKILTQLEAKYAEFDGLNLSWETLDGIAKHNGPNKNPPKAIADFDKKFPLELDKFSSLEAQIASFADDIAYISHDIDDGIRAKLFSIHSMMDVPLLGRILSDVVYKYPNIEIARVMHETHRRILSVMVEDVLNETKKRIAANKIESVEDVRACGVAIAGFSEGVAKDIKSIKDWLMTNMYRHYKVNRMSSKARRIVVELYEFFMEEPNCLPTEWQQKAEKLPLAECVADYIAGMTDRFAQQEYQKIFLVTE